MFRYNFNYDPMNHKTKNHLSLNKNIWKVSRLPAAWSPRVGGSALLSLLCFMHLYTSPNDQKLWMLLPAEGEEQGRFLKSQLFEVMQDWCHMPVAQFILVLSPPIFFSFTVSILQLKQLSSAHWRSTRVHDLQGGVDVDKNDDDQVEDGPNDAQHGQDALLLTFLVLDSLFLITAESVYHFPWKSLQFSSQTNLEQADKKRKTNTIHV